MPNPERGLPIPEEISSRNSYNKIMGQAEPPNWITLLGQACLLLVKLWGEEDLKISLNWEVEGPYHIFSEVQYGRLVLFRETTPLAGYDLIPRTSFISEENLTRQLVTVTEEAVIYRDLSVESLNEEDRQTAEEFHRRLLKLLDYPAMQEEEDPAALEWPDSVEIIKAILRPYYLEVDLAIPGSRPVPPEEWLKTAPGRMLLLREIPDMGKIRSRWLFHSEENIHSQAEKDGLEKIFRKALDKALSHPTLWQTARFDGANKIAQLVVHPSQAGAWDEKLKRWIPEPDTQEPESLFRGGKIPFPDYIPKEEPDTLLDFRPDLTDSVQALPDAAPENLPELLDLFRKYHAMAEKDPGTWEPGNPILGLPDPEYRPSEGELLLAETGEKICSIIKSSPPETLYLYTGSAPAQIIYRKFSFAHSDVMGSGRFFYIGHQEKIKLEVPHL